jgi:hypothetical protein
MGQRAIQLKTGWTLYEAEAPRQNRQIVKKEIIMSLLKTGPQPRQAATWKHKGLWTMRIYAALPILVIVDLLFQAKDLPMEKILGVQFLGGALLSLLV